MDTSYVDAALSALLPVVRPGDLVVGKSTVPVGNAARLAAVLTEAAPGVLLAWNPEFLREGHAVSDTQHPDRIVYGLPAEPDDAAAPQPCWTPSTPTPSPRTPRSSRWTTPPPNWSRPPPTP